MRNTIFISSVHTLARIGVHTSAFFLFMKKIGVAIAQLPSMKQTLELLIKMSVFFRLKLGSPIMVPHLQLIYGNKKSFSSIINVSVVFYLAARQ